MYLDSEEWAPIRLGSKFEVPSLHGNDFVNQFLPATGNRKKLYERAVARALYNACERVLGKNHQAVAYDGGVSWQADERLFQRTYS